MHLPPCHRPQGLAGIKDLSFLGQSPPCYGLWASSDEALEVCSVWPELRDLKCLSDGDGV